MSFVSYAQNYEDVMLWRALQHVAHGFYIDVGAQSADLDSVTRAFSERGWRGINIEPHAFYFEQLVERRPRDINLKLAVGDEVGEIPMYFVEKSGLSTADKSIADGHAAAGYSIQVEDVVVTTLSSLCSVYVPAGQDVHFLKIDVEGFERAVLAGNDWALNRPWITVVEATLPNSRIERHMEWEQILVDAKYDFVYADGLNRYYVAQERQELSIAFKYPPNVFDKFVRASTMRALEASEALEKGLLTSQRNENAVRRLLSESQHRVAVAEQSLITMRQRIHAVRREYAGVQAQIDLVQQQYAAVLHSTSWKLTSPLRKAVAAVPLEARRNARRAARLAWWTMTPWRLPERLRFIRGRSTRPVQSKTPPVILDFYSDTALQQATGVPREAMLWAPEHADTVVDDASAARWCLDLIRARPQLRSRFPAALSARGEASFSAWLQDAGGSELGLSTKTLHALGHLFNSDFSARARQYFLFRTDVRAGLPHGLTPAGQLPLFKWFTSHGRAEGDFSAEEVLWLFMQAAENPALELVRAYLFTAPWQKQHPEGLSAFGRDAFASWFTETYAVTADWTEPLSWPIDISVACQLRQAYFARPRWQALHPDAMKNVLSATAFVDWLFTEDAALSATSSRWCAGLDRRVVADQLAAGGVNLIGHFCCPSGVRVSAEALVEGLRCSGVATSLRDLRTNVQDEPNHVRFDGFEDFDTTIIHTQPEPFFDVAYERSDLAERHPRTYRIAYWYWEFDSIPDSWSEQASKVDEVWAATEFVAKGLRERLSVPVKTLFPGVQLGRYERRERSHFGLDNGKYTFLFNFHMNSVMERKNPLGLIAAFKAAFRPAEPVALVVKTMFGHYQPKQLHQLKEAAAGSNITIIDEIFSSDEVLSLMDACDAYVSLHRSEGLGLTMAEAMLMGKPVIATNYSGNVDFMDESNSLLVPYELVELGKPLPPYAADFVWAEPSVEHAARLMRQVFDDPEAARRLGASAKAIAETRLSVATAGQKIAQRLAEIKAMRRSA